MKNVVGPDIVFGSKIGRNACTLLMSGESISRSLMRLGNMKARPSTRQAFLDSVSVKARSDDASFLIQEVDSLHVSRPINRM